MGKSNVHPIRPNSAEYWKEVADNFQEIARSGMRAVAEVQDKLIKLYREIETKDQIIQRLNCELSEKDEKIKALEREILTQRMQTQVLH